MQVISGSQPPPCCLARQSSLHTSGRRSPALQLHTGRTTDAAGVWIAAGGNCRRAIGPAAQPFLEHRMRAQCKRAHRQRRAVERRQQPIPVRGVQDVQLLQPPQPAGGLQLARRRRGPVQLQPARAAASVILALSAAGAVQLSAALPRRTHSTQLSFAVIRLSCSLRMQLVRTGCRAKSDRAPSRSYKAPGRCRSASPSSSAPCGLAMGTPRGIEIEIE